MKTMMIKNDCPLAGCGLRLSEPDERSGQACYCPLAGCGLRLETDLHDYVDHGYCPLAGCGLRPSVASPISTETSYCPLAGCGLRLHFSRVCGQLLLLLSPYGVWVATVFRYMLFQL